MIISCIAIVRGEKINLAKISPISCAPEQYSERVGGIKDYSILQFRFAKFSQWSSIHIARDFASLVQYNL